MKRATVQFAGGLGNQLFIYSFAVWLKENGQNPVLNLNRIDSSHNLSYYDFRNLINLDNSFDLVESKWYRFNAFWLSHVSDALRSRHMVGNSLFFADFYQTFRYFDSLKNPFRLKDQSVSVVNTKEIANMINQSGKCLIHVRLGDLLTSNGSWILNAEFYEKSISLLSDDSKPGGWVVTDSPKLMTRYLAGTTLENYKVLNISSPIDCFYLISQCERVVLSNSTFALWASKLTVLDKQKVVVPTHLNKNLPTKELDFPDSWDAYNSSWLNSNQIQELKGIKLH